MTQWKLVPVEPTEEMLKAGTQAWDNDLRVMEFLDLTYHLMLAAAPQPDVQPVAWVDLLKEADQIVKNKPTWKRFIDGTPLSNDIAVWMADFAQEYASPPPAADVQELVEALKLLMPLVVTDAFGCNGDKCRQAWCWSCNGEEYAESAANSNRVALDSVKKVLAKWEGK